MTINIVQSAVEETILQFEIENVSRGKAAKSTEVEISLSTTSKKCG